MGSQKALDAVRFAYENGIADYVTELAGEGSLTLPVCWQAERRGRDREDKPEYKLKFETETGETGAGIESLIFIPVSGIIFNEILRLCRGLPMIGDGCYG